MKRRLLFIFLMTIFIIFGIKSLPNLAQEMQYDYAPNTRIPAIGRVTIRDNIRNLPANKRFTRCPSNSNLIEFAESTNYLVMICSDERDRNRHKYWIQRSKHNRLILRLIASFDVRGVPDYPNGQYTYYIYADGGGRINAYLERCNQTRRCVSEALFYHYSRWYEKRE
ncbi:hypothetical protein [Aerosakkonema funiforme]|uniref:hypothetical protein n=1 Tax=Aerosakkonema funiforme TaxID=1246630 RepID=UPI0035BC72DE